jgi:Protein of unknown function (DUF1194)
MGSTVRLATLALAIIGFCSFTRPASADEGQVDMLLVLASDVSRSVDDQKFKLQREGYANAIADPRVMRAMTGGPHGRIAIAFVEWASDHEQRVVIGWTIIGNAEQAEGVAQRFREAPRSFWGRTSISGGIDYSVALLERSPFQSTRRVINVSGDGDNNGGRPVTEARDDAVAKGITINGLVILTAVPGFPVPASPSHTNPLGGLRAYYENNVIGGPGAFVVDAGGFESFGQSLIGKLIKEIAEAVGLSVVR